MNTETLDLIQRPKFRQQSHDTLPCGHPRGCDDGTGCAWCEEVARLRELILRNCLEDKTLLGIEAERLRGELERLWGDDGHPHESGEECIGCERLATERGWPWCNQCLLETQLAYADDAATVAMIEVERLHKELAQAALREVSLVEAANALVQRLAAMNLEKPEAIALGNALAYGPEVTALQDILALEASSD